MATHSSILAWRIPWTEEPSRVQSTVLHRVLHDWSDWACTPAWFLGISTGGSVVKNMPVNAGRILKFAPWVGKFPWRRKWQPTPVFLPGKSHCQRSLGATVPWGRKRVGLDLATKTTTVKKTKCEACKFKYI